MSVNNIILVFIFFCSTKYIPLFLYFSYLLYEISMVKNNDMEIANEYLQRSELAVNVTNRIVASIRIQRLRIKKNKKMKGGRSKKKCLEDWKTGVNLYRFSVFYCELDSLSLLNVIGKFAHENVETKILLDEERRNRSAIESKLIALLTESDRKVSMYEGKFRNLFRKDKARGPAKSKSFHLLSKSQQRRTRKSIEEVCGENLWFLEQFNFKATKIVIFNEEKCALETINLVGENNVNLPELTNENVNNVNMLLLVKDKFNISDAVFKELSQLCVGMPTFLHLKIN